MHLTSSSEMDDKDEKEDVREGDRRCRSCGRPVAVGDDAGEDHREPGEVE